MKKCVLLGVFAVLMSMPIIMAAAEEPIAPSVQVPKYIILESNDRQQVTVPKEIAELSTTIKNFIEDMPKGEIIPLSEITGSTLSKLKPLMEFAHLLQNDPFKERLQKISAKASTDLAAATLAQWSNLLLASEYLDIEILKVPLANAMIQHIHAMHAGDRDKIARTVESLHISDEYKVSNEFKGLLAKYWYLNYGAEKNYILPDLDFGFSIEELANYNKLPRQGKILRGFFKLENFRINDITGLNLIPGIESAQLLDLSHNKLTTLPEKTFDQFKKLENLDLSHNQLTTLLEKIFDRLTILATLDLSHNQLTTLPEKIFDKLEAVYNLNLSSNKLKTLPKGIFDRLNKLFFLVFWDNELDPAQKNALKEQFGNKFID